ncbi:MAG: peptidoglycan bridge formation glycyltransferase FemA/FemB family protein [Chloroflexi bacterium]|nr:peptidoglycan bridge formation glycyltransferase FemA/FemB family protein [Chloroflexota bacterium]
MENPDADAWDELIATQHGHLLQTRAWGELKTRFGWRVTRLALARDDALIAGAQMLVRDLPLGLRFAYVPRGPVADANDHAALTALDDALVAHACACGAFVLRVEPNAFAMPNEILGVPAPTIQPQTTIHVDLTRDLATILAQMKPKWRYNIRLAERKGVTVREGKVCDIGLFYHLLEITRTRDQFAIHSRDYYRAALDLLGECAQLFIAEHAGDALAAIFVTAVGDEAIYLFGASSNEQRERMPNHALHWAAMQWAKARGCARYDLWGLGATTNADESAAHGLYQFKQGFGGTFVQYAGARDVIFSHWKYALYARAVAWRRGALG